jgi:hypothetical protein
MKTTTTKREIRFKSGLVIPFGTSFECFFNPERNDRVFFQYEGVTKSLRLETSHKYLTGFSKPPSINTLEKWDSENGVCKTPTGFRTEPDGYGPDGSPSWLLVLGMI